MAKALFLCTSKTGIETFTVQLEPVAELVSPACPVCKKTTHEDLCRGDDPKAANAVTHDPVEMVEGDTSFFKDLPHGNIFLSPLTAEAGAQFEVGKLTEISFELVK